MDSNHGRVDSVAQHEVKVHVLAVVSCRCHMNGEKNYKKRIIKEMRRKI
jgi:hypothetical protein